MNKSEAMSALKKYLKDKGLPSGDVADLLAGISDQVNDKIEANKQNKKEAKLDHGTSCPRVMTNDEEDCLFEM